LGFREKDEGMFDWDMNSLCHLDVVFTRAIFVRLFLIHGIASTRSSFRKYMSKRYPLRSIHPSLHKHGLFVVTFEVVICVWALADSSYINVKSSAILSVTGHSVGDFLVISITLLTQLYSLF